MFEFTQAMEIDDLSLHLKGECEQFCPHCFDEMMIRQDDAEGWTLYLMHEEQLARELGVS